MLENEAYNKALISYKKLSQEHASSGRDLFYSLIILPDYKEQAKRNVPLLIEIAGIPRSVKTTLLRNSQKSFNNIEILPEYIDLAKREGRQKYPNNQAGLLSMLDVSKIIIAIAGTTVMVSTSSKNNVIFSDKNMVDHKIFDRALFVESMYNSSFFEIIRI